MKKDFYGKHIQINADTKIISDAKHRDGPYCHCQVCLDEFGQYIADLLKKIPAKE